MSEPHGHTERYDELAKLARTMPHEPSSAQLMHGWLRLRGAGAFGRRGSTKGRWLLAGVVVCAVAAIVFRPWRKPEEVLSYQVDSGVRGASGEVAADEAKHAKLQFSDGTQFDLAPSARATVGPLAASEPHIALDDGTTEVRVNHRDGARWLVAAGPFVVTVTGTAFTLGWTGNDRFEIQMHAGTVSVVGPLLDGARKLSAGQTLAVRLASKEVTFDDATKPVATQPESTSAATPTGEPAGQGADEVATEPSEARGRRALDRKMTGPSRAEETPPVGWSALLARGKVSEIVADAESRGLDTAIAQVREADLAALADAARYTRRADVARRALRAERERFSRSSRANDAAFFLGRLDESDGATSSAMTWYQRYLNEAPQGSYASEALGREMSLVVRLSGKAKAAPLAEQYLTRFPAGAYAAPARSILGRP